MGLQALHNQLIVIHSFVAIFSRFLFKEPKGLYDEVIIRHHITLRDCIGFLPLKYFLQENDKLKQCLGIPGL